MTATAPTKETDLESGVDLIDRFAWIVLRLPKRLWEKGQETLEELTSVLDFNMNTGEVSERPALTNGERKVLKDTNITNILHHMVDPNVVKPNGFDEVLELLKKNSIKVSPAPLPDAPARTTRPANRIAAKGSASRSRSASPDEAKSPQRDDISLRSPRRPPRREVTSNKYRAQYIEKTKG